MSKIPAQAACVFKGIVYDVYQWQQPLFDGSITTFEMLKRADTVVVIPLTAEGAVCYAWQEQPAKPPFLSLFGGRAEEGETPLEAAKRELKEETGFESSAWQLLRTCPVGGKIDWTIYIFVARNCVRVCEPHLDGGEKIEIRTVPLDRFIDDVVLASTFSEIELRQEVCSAFDPAKAAALCAEIKGDVCV